MIRNELRKLKTDNLTHQTDDFDKLHKSVKLTDESSRIQTSSSFKIEIPNVSADFASDVFGEFECFVSSWLF